MKEPQRTLWKHEIPQTGGSTIKKTTRFKLSTLLSLIARFGLDYQQIARKLSILKRQVERIVLAIERHNSQLMQKALGRFKRRLRKTGRKLERQDHGFFPLEYYLLKSFDF